VRFEQFIFFRQWQELRLAAQARGVQLFGDLPIFVAHDSADVWRSANISNSMPSVSRAWWLACAGLFFRERTALGQPAVQLDTPGGRWVPLVDRAPAHAAQPVRSRAH